MGGICERILAVFLGRSLKLLTGIVVRGELDSGNHDSQCEMWERLDKWEWAWVLEREMVDSVERLERGERGKRPCGVSHTMP